MAVGASPMEDQTFGRVAAVLGSAVRYSLFAIRYSLFALRLRNGMIKTEAIKIMRIHKFQAD